MIRALLLSALALSFLAAPALASPPQGGPYWNCQATVNNGASASCSIAGQTVGDGISCGTTNCSRIVLTCSAGNGPGPTYAPRCS